MQAECNTEIKMNVSCSTKNFFPLDINHNMVFEIADLFQEKVTRSFGLVFFFSFLWEVEGLCTCFYLEGEIKKPQPKYSEPIFLN